MKQFIVYDLDGTLVDTREDIACAANHMLQTMGAEVLAPSEIERYVGRGLHHLVKSCLKTDDDKSVKKGAKTYRDYYARHMLDHTRLYPGALEVLNYFKGRHQAVITNKPNPFSRDILRDLGVLDYFLEVVAGDAGYPRKPDPTAVLSLMQQTKAKAEETLLVGDSEIDIETARNAGVDTVAITHGFVGEDTLRLAQPDHIVRHFEEAPWTQPLG